MKNKHIPSVVVPTSSSSSTHSLLRTISELRLRFDSFILLDPLREMDDVLSAGTHDYRIGDRPPSGTSEARKRELNQRTAGWSLFSEGLSQSQLKTFVDVLLPDTPTPSREIRAIARQLIIDVVNTLAKTPNPRHHQIWDTVSALPLEVLHERLRGTASASYMHPSNAGQADHVRSVACQALAKAPPDGGNIIVSVQSLPSPSAMLFSGDFGRWTLAIVDLAAKVRGEFATYVLFGVQPEGELTAALERARWVNPVAKVVRQVPRALNLFRNKLDCMLEPLIWHEPLQPGAARPRGGYKLMRLGGAELFPHCETQAFVFVGGPGSGKTTAMLEALDHAVANEWPCVIYDPAGEFTRSYYNPDRGDIILSPLDKRSPSWNIFRDLRYSYDFEKVTSSLIDSKNDKDPFWPNASRLLLRGILHGLIREKRTTNEALHEAVSKLPLANEVSKEQQKEYLEEALSLGLVSIDAQRHAERAAQEGTLLGLLWGTEAYNFMARGGKTADNVRMDLMSRLAVWAYLKDDAAPFSIVDFVRNPGKRVLILQSRADMAALLRPLLTLWLDLAVTTQLSLPEDPTLTRRMVFSIDELPSLQKMDSLRKLIAEGRKYGATVMLGLQVLPQLFDAYEEYGGRSIIGLVGTYVAFRSPEPTSAKYLSEVFGNSIKKNITGSRAISANDDRDQVTYGQARQKEALLIEGDFQTLPILTAWMSSPNAPAVKVSFMPKPRKPAGTDAFREPDGRPLGYAPRDDINIEQAIEEASKAQATREALALELPTAAEGGADLDANAILSSMTAFVHAETEKTLLKASDVATDSFDLDLPEPFDGTDLPTIGEGEFDDESVDEFARQ